MPQTLVSFLLDRSGSMDDGIDVTIESFNGYVDGLRAEREAEILFNLVTFSTTSVDRVCSGVPVAAAPRLSRHNYRPTGGTPLIDAAVKMIHAVDKQVAERPDAKVVVVIQTDGEENASREFKTADLHDLIKARTAAGWQFIFMGADIDAYDMAAQYGISQDATISYGKLDLAASGATMRATATNTADFSAGRRQDVAYSTAQRSTAGDKFRPEGQPAEKPAARPPVVDDIAL